jgi:phosphoribosylamine--glycine ligase
MNVLLLGSGGREHAMAWKLAQSSLLTQLHIAPGNAGMEGLGILSDLDALDFSAVERYVKKHQIHLVVVGPEAPLVAGLADHLRSMDPAPGVIGPGKDGAQLEGSKAFSKAFMRRQNIPTARYGSFGAGETDAALNFLNEFSPPYVIKADGLAAGKGVVIVDDLDQARTTVREMLSGRAFGAAGERVVIEEFLDGIEVSMFCLTDGHTFQMLPSAKDYKRVGIGDTGPNTGGMGAISPVPFVSPEFQEKALNQIIIPTIKGLEKEGIPYVGFLFFGLIKVGSDPFVIEYNCRLGDPETEVLMPRIKSDLLDLLDSAASGMLSESDIEIDPRAAATVVVASGGYPGTFEKGLEISGLDHHPDVEGQIFHAGTRLMRKKFVTHGGRVLACTGWGDRLSTAVSNARTLADGVAFEGAFHRTDIGQDVLDLERI